MATATDGSPLEDETYTETNIAVPNVHFELGISLSIPVRNTFLRLESHNIFEFAADPDWSLIERILSSYTNQENSRYIVV